MTVDTATGWRSPALDRPGAVPADGLDAGVAWHYGDPAREQRLLAVGAAVVDLSHRGLVRVSGTDRLRWLHSLTTQALADLPAGASTETLLLDPHGHIENAMQVVDDGTSTWLGTEPGAAGALLAWLERMRFLLDVQVDDASSAWAAVGTVASAPGALPGDGEGAAIPGNGEGAATAGAVRPPSWQDPWPGVAEGSAAYTPDLPEGHPGLGRPWRVSYVPRDGLADALGGRDLAGTWAAEALRAAAWRPRLGFETDHRSLPHELDWLRTAVHLTKGCYRGQETVARVHNLGHPPRRLVALHLDGSEHVLPAQGAALLLAGRPVGNVTTAARHHELGPIALAVVKRSTPLEAVLEVEGIAAAQEQVVGG